MDATFWHQRWEQGRTGWHQQEVDRLLRKHWPALQVPAGARVWVPLCGSSLDLAWLAARGHRVFGVELSPLACRAFFEREGVAPDVRHAGAFEVYSGAGVELWAGDAFELAPADLAGVGAVYDRAALIALPPALRRRYAERLYGALPPGCAGLLITLEYPQQQRAGPPFAVDEAEVRALFGRDWQLEHLERRDILDHEPGFRADGIRSLHTSVYRMRRSAAA
jgi:thiopurine S-methyltransferase